MVTKRRGAPTMTVPCESPDGSTTLVYSEAPAEIKDVMVVKSVRCAEVMVAAVSDTVLGSVSVGSVEETVLESCSLVKLEEVVVLVGSVEAAVLEFSPLVKLEGVVVLEIILVESCSLVVLEDVRIVAESTAETVLVESCSLVKLEEVVVLVESVEEKLLVESCSLVKLEEVVVLEPMLVESCSLVKLEEVVVLVESVVEIVLVKSCPLAELESTVVLVGSAEGSALVEFCPLLEIELLVICPEDKVEEEEEELGSTVLDREVVLVLVSRLDVCVLLRELEDEDGEVVAGVDSNEDVGLAEMLDTEVEVVLDVTDGPGEKEEVDGTPTTTYPEFVPEEGTIDVNPVAPAGICVVLVAYAWA